MNREMKSEYTAPTFEWMTLTVEPYLLDSGLDVADGGGDEPSISPRSTSGTWTPWV